MIELIQKTSDFRLAIRAVAEMYNYDYAMIMELIKLAVIKIKHSRQ